MAMAYSWESFIRIHGGEPGARSMFEKAMDELLRTENPDKEVHLVKAVQGDGGIDIFVYQDEGIDVYQCKFFMGSMNSSRWYQIKKSFNRAVEYMNSDKTKGVKMLHWFLCMPREMQKEDIARWDTFRKTNEGVEIKLIDGNEIINRMQNCDRQNGTSIIDRYFYISKSAYEDMTTVERFYNAPKRTIDVLIIVATEDEEKAIVNNEEWEKGVSDKGYIYYTRTEGKVFALVRSIEMRETNVGVIAQHFIDFLKPIYIAMAGFCAGKKGDVVLGDVIIPSTVYRYGIGKQKGENELLPEIHAFNLDYRWKQKAERFGDGWRTKINIVRPVDYSYQKYIFMKQLIDTQGGSVTIDFWNKTDMPDLPRIVTEYVETNDIVFGNNMVILTEEGRKNFTEELFKKYWNGYQAPSPATKVGVLATGANVQQWSGIFDLLSSKYDRKTVAIDMEAAAIGFLGAFNQKKFLVAKGVGDFAHDNKAFDNRFVGYSCYVSYRFIVEFFNSLQPYDE